MIGSIISFIGDFAKTCNVGGGDVYFECDSADLIAVKIDTVPRTNDDGHANFFVYVEPPVYSNYILPRGRIPHQQTTVRVYFCGFVEMHSTYEKGSTEFSDNDMTTRTRLAVQDTIERRLVRPFLQALKKSDMAARFPDSFANLRINYRAEPRFDANEISIYVEFQWEEGLCAEDYA